MLYEIKKANGQIDYSKVKKSNFASINWKEKDLEKLLSDNIDDFINSQDLMTIFTERSLQEEPDIMALDSKGDLYIFELKRWASNQENLLQVLRYGQIFGNSSYSELNTLYSKYTKNSRVALSERHREYFKLDKNLNEKEFNMKQHFIIVVNGLDMKTIEAIIYWKKIGIDISAIIYYVYDIEGKHYLEFNMYSPIEGYLEYETNCYLLNTNHSNDPLCTDDMIKNHKAAAYCVGWKEKISKFQKGDIIFLYKTGAGIVAYGNANGILNKSAYNGIAEDEYSMHLDNFVVLKRSVPASEMKVAVQNIASNGFQFRQTLCAIEENVAKELIKYFDIHKLIP